MNFGSKTRRWIAGICLAAALLMLIPGLTVLSNRIAKPSVFFMYWMICFGLTAIAALIALVDLMLVNRQFRQAEKELIESTLNEAKNESQNRLS